jgi:molecular chaperone GrpE
MSNEEIKKTNEEEVADSEEKDTIEQQNDQQYEANAEIENLKVQLNDKATQCEEYMNKLHRTAAEFDNYKKRTAREKDALYSEAVGDAVAEFLPVIDNMERALEACCNDGDGETLKNGVEMIFKQLTDVMKKLGVEEIQCKGETFDPQLHNAVMHIDDEAYDDNVIIEEFQKGYKIKDRVLRHSMVKVAN